MTTPSQHQVVSPRILLVDDNPQELELLGVAFEEIGQPAHIEICTTGFMALAMLIDEGQNRPGGLPNVILLDINMPLVDGTHLLQGIKSEDRLSGIPTIMITGCLATVDPNRCRELGALDVLEKPEGLAGYTAIARRILSIVNPG